MPVTFGAANGPPVHDTDRSPPAETVPAAGVAAPAEATYAEVPPASSSRPRPAASERRRAGSKELENIG